MDISTILVMLTAWFRQRRKEKAVFRGAQWRHPTGADGHRQGSVRGGYRWRECKSRRRTSQGEYDPSPVFRLGTGVVSHAQVWPGTLAT